MPGKPIKLGPFIGGMNTASDPTSISDNQLVDVVNMELDLDGSLISRPPIQSATDDAADWTERIKLLGCAIYNSDPYLLGSNANGIYQYFSGAWTKLGTPKLTCMAQYAGTVYFLGEPQFAQNICTWNPTAGFINGSHPNFVSMSGTDAGGSACVVYKNRMFYIPGPNKSQNDSRLIFSDPGAPEAFSNTTQFIDINPGDGQKLIDAVVYDDNLVLFKEHSTYVLSYTSKPDDAELLKINNTIGASTSNCVVSYENSVFVFHKGDVYEMVNYDFRKINLDVPFFYDPTVGLPNPRSESVYLCLFGDRLMVRYYNRLYIYGLRTKTWSRWESAEPHLHNIGILVPLPVDVTNRTNTEYYAGSCVSSNDQFYVIKDGYSLTDVEKYSGTTYAINCSVTTKTYDMSDAYQFKKQNWWGVDASTNQMVKGNANPVTFKFLSTWGSLSASLWSDLLTWASPGAANVSNTVVANPDGSTVLRRFIRFPKALRFRQINYQVIFSTDGSTNQGPVKLFSLVVFGSAKEILPAQVN